VGKDVGNVRNTIADYALAALSEAQITECPQALEQAAAARRKRHD
jgi:hypothetical protein